MLVVQARRTWQRVFVPWPGLRLWWQRCHDFRFCSYDQHSVRWDQATKSCSGEARDTCRYLHPETIGRTLRIEGWIHQHWWRSWGCGILFEGNPTTTRFWAIRWSHQSPIIGRSVWPKKSTHLLGFDRGSSRHKNTQSQSRGYYLYTCEWYIERLWVAFWVLSRASRLILWNRASFDLPEWVYK